MGRGFVIGFERCPRTILVPGTVTTKCWLGRSYGLSKAEVVHRRGLRQHFDAVACVALERVGRFDARRLPEPIGDVPAAQVEAHSLAQALTACAKSDGLR